jgi:hypothetical protein
MAVKSTSRVALWPEDTSASNFIGPRDWDNVELVASGARKCWLKLCLANTYRCVHERLGNEEVPYFEIALIPRLQAETARSAMGTEWIGSNFGQPSRAWTHVSLISWA